MSKPMNTLFPQFFFPKFVGRHSILKGRVDNNDSNPIDVYYQGKYAI